MKRKSDTVVRYPVLGEIISADPFAAIAGTNLDFAWPLPSSACCSAWAISQSRARSTRTAFSLFLI